MPSCCFFNQSLNLCNRTLETLSLPTRKGTMGKYNIILLIPHSSQVHTIVGGFPSGGLMIWLSSCFRQGGISTTSGRESRIPGSVIEVLLLYCCIIVLLYIHTQKLDKVTYITKHTRCYSFCYVLVSHLASLPRSPLF